MARGGNEGSRAPPPALPSCLVLHEGKGWGGKRDGKGKAEREEARGGNGGGRRDDLADNPVELPGSTAPCPLAQQELRLEAAKEMLQYQRVKERCWDTVEQLHMQLFAFGVEGTFTEGRGSMSRPPPPPRVCRLGNFPIRKLTAAEKRRIHVVAFLRKVEVLEWEKRPSKDRGHVAVVGYQEVGGTEKAGGEGIAGEDSNLSKQSDPVDDDRLVGENHQAVGWGPENLLYKELALHCPLRRRSQALMLDGHIVQQVTRGRFPRRHPLLWTLRIAGGENGEGQVEAPSGGGREGRDKVL